MFFQVRQAQSHCWSAGLLVFNIADVIFCSICNFDAHSSASGCFCTDCRVLPICHEHVTTKLAFAAHVVKEKRLTSSAGISVFSEDEFWRLGAAAE